MADIETLESTTADHQSGVVRLRRGAKALVAMRTRVLLIKERHGDGSPFWTLPGGGVPPGESPVEGLRRELGEELGCSVHVGDVVTRFWYAHQSRRNVLTRYTVFSSTLASAVRPDAAEGVLDFRWVPPTAPRSGPSPRSGSYSLTQGAWSSGSGDRRDGSVPDALPKTVPDPRRRRVRVDPVGTALLRRRGE